MSWNYRIVYDLDEKLYSIREVYYDNENTPRGYCTARVDNWEDKDQLINTLDFMRQAQFRPILQVDDKHRLTELDDVI